ncbi:MAG: hypothetical protein NTU98_10485 [Bacteroidetes bacterium]|nr:hypothetical protein [Bacteroidota bacterium]
MKKFCIRLLIILLPFLVVFSIIEYRAGRLPTSYAQKKKFLELQEDSVKVLVFGSSHAFDDINPEFFSCKGYNFSNVSQSLFYDTRLCLKYLDRLPHLRAVILDVSYFSLFYELNELPESWRDYFYYRYFGIRYPSLDLSDPKAFTYTALYTRDFINAVMFSKVNEKEEFGDIQSNGWKKVPAPVDSLAISDSTGHKNALFHRTLVRMEYLQKNLRYLRELLTELKKRNIRICFVTTPLYKTYSAYLDPAVLQMNRTILTGLCGEYDAVYLNYMNDLRFLKSDFSDNDHLNIAGAEKFSKILDEDFIKPTHLIP